MSRGARSERGAAQILLVLGLLLGLIAFSVFYFLAARQQAVEAQEQALLESDRAHAMLVEAAEEDARREALSAGVALEDMAEDADHDHEHDHEHDAANDDPELVRLRAERDELKAQVEQLRAEVEAIKKAILEDG